MATQVVFGAWDLELDEDEDGSSTSAWDAIYGQAEAALVAAGLPSTYSDRWSEADEGCQIVCDDEAEATRIVATLEPICSVLTNPIDTEVQS